MANLQIAEVLYGAKVFVLHVADEVSFRARALLAMDRGGSRSDQGIIDDFEDELPTAVQAMTEVWHEPIPLEDEGLFLGAAGPHDLPKVDLAQAEAAMLSAPRPSPAELAHVIARSMFTPETGLPATDDSIDR